MPQSLSLITGRRREHGRPAERAVPDRGARPCITPLAAVLIGAMSCAGPLAAQEGAPPYPAVVLDSMIARGRQIYAGASGCARCHGEGGRGTSEGPDLTDDEWLRGSGRYEEIVELVRHGVARRDAKTGKPMPIGGWEPLSEEAVRAVAAYVWSMRGGSSPPR